MTREIAVFVHIPKNGGKTVDYVLRRGFGDGLLITGNTTDGVFFTDGQVRQIVVDHPHIAAISSHAVRAPMPPVEGVTYSYLTFLRHPVERALSLYFHEQRRMRAAGKEHCALLPFPEYFEERVKIDSAITNGQTHHIAGSDDLAAATALLEGYSTVGILEYFDESLVMLRRTFGLPLRRLAYVRQNVGKTFTAKEHLSPEVYERVASMNVVDMQLYDQFVARHERSIKAEGGAFMRELEAFRWMASGRARLRSMLTPAERFADRLLASGARS